MRGYVGTDRLPDGVPAAPARRPVRARRAAAATAARAPGSTRRAGRPRSAAARDAPGPARRGDRAAPAVADRRRGARRAALRQDRAGRAGRRRAGPLGRLSDLGWGSRLRELLRPGAPTATSPTTCSGAVVEVLAGVGLGRSGPVAVVAMASRTPAAAGRLAGPAAGRGRPAALPRRAGPGRRRAARRRRGEQQRAAAGRRPRRVRGSRRSWPRAWPSSTRRCCWSTTCSTPAGR